ncbi:MAG: peroxiredoxin [Opitutales bacterium]|nr:peroxiredoxin [Opitutales bacterium]|tara:strand:- start:767 stop:1237 length:471 start_codon:yes stop_codon:yes gene_type:complete
MALTIGTEAPDFTLKTKTAEGLEEVNLRANRGQHQTVLLFFPLAFTGVCMQEMCSVRDDLSVYEDLGAKVYGISVDSPFSLEVMAQQENINFPLISDFNKEVAQSYGVLYEELLGFHGVAKRSAFVVDKDGTISYSWSSDDPHDLPNFDEIKGALG